jgi:hypothetical protein
MKSIASFKWILILYVIALIFFLAGQFIPGAGMFMAFAGGTFSAATCRFILHYEDVSVLKNVDTYTEIIINKNMAYAVYYLTNGLIIVVSFAAAFLVFLTLK